MTVETKGRAGPGRTPQTGTDASQAITNANGSPAADAVHPSATAAGLPIAGALAVTDLGVDQRRKRRTTALRCGCGTWHLFRGHGSRKAPCGRRYMIAARSAVAA